MSSSGKLLFVGTLAVTLALTANSCSVESTSPANETTVSILLTDAPGDLEHAWVKIMGIYLQGGGDEGDGDGGRVWLLDEETGWIDLLELSNATVELVKDVPVPAGHYSQLRLVLGDVAIVDTEAKVFATSDADLSELPGELTAAGLAHCPSCDRSGLKVRLPGGGVVLEEANTIIVDFDVSQTFGRERGNSNRWVMHPVLIATDFTTAGKVTGKVSIADGFTLPSCSERPVTLQDFIPIATNSEGDKAGTVDDQAQFTIPYLTPGEYTLGFLTPVEIDINGTLWSVTFEATADPGTVTVEPGQVATADYTVSGATCTSG